MAIDSLTPVSSFSPAVQDKAPQPFEVDEEGNIVTSDPKLSLQQNIIRTLFGDKKGESDTHGNDKQVEVPQKPQPVDTVEVSAQALEYSRKTHAEVTIKDGDAEIKVVLDHQETLRIEQTQTQSSQPQQSSDPLILDLNGNGIELTDATKGGGVRFDITADGKTENVSWAKATDGFLVYDRNGNGTIDNGKELFGDQNGAADGFAELAKFDANGDNTIDNKDSIFAKLGVWQDANQNGVSETDEVKSLDGLGIKNIDLFVDKARSMISNNLMTGYSSYQTASGTSGKIGEAYLNYLA